MARTRSITDKAILDAAREVFLDKGYSATTAEIARHAGISEGTIFRRFPNKEALFCHALGTHDEPRWMALADALDGVDRDATDTGIRLVLSELYTFFREMIPRMIGVMASPVELHRVLSLEAEPLPVRGHQALARCFSRLQALGLLELPAPPMVVARIAIGSVHSHAFFDQVGLNEQLGLSIDAVLDGIVNLLHSGSTPLGEEAAS